MTTEKNPKMAFYLRSATGDTEHLNRQKRLLEKFISQKSDLINGEIETYTDETQSGLKPGPEYLRMCQNIKDGKIDVVIVSEHSRISRSSRELFNFLDFIKAEKCRFLTIHENIDTARWFYLDLKPIKIKSTNGELKNGCI